MVKLINFVDKPATIEFDKSGKGSVPLDPSHDLPTGAFRRVHLRIGSTQASKYSLYFGKISNTTLAEPKGGKIDGRIHSYDIDGPEISLLLTGGPKHGTEKVKLWVYLTD